MQRKYPFTPILGWSVSRYDKFEMCKRQYWYDYYAKKYDREVSPQRLNFLKSLTSTHLEIGNVVHDAIATQLHRLKKRMPQDTSEVMNYSYYLVDRAISSKTFLEVYYQQQDKIDTDDLKERVGTCLRNFFQSRWYQWLTTEDNSHHWNEWVIEPNDFGEVRINGLKAYCKVDFLFPTVERDLYILDWKTGKVDREKHRKQMTGYVVYAQDVFQATADQVKPMVVYLGGSYEELEHGFIQSELDDFARQVSLQTQSMYKYCENIEENIPKPKDFFSRNVRRLCAYCNYQELCEN